jgi:hypothetical protein
LVCWRWLDQKDLNEQCGGTQDIPAVRATSRELAPSPRLAASPFALRSSLSLPFLLGEIAPSPPLSPFTLGDLASRTLDGTLLGPADMIESDRDGGRFASADLADRWELIRVGWVARGSAVCGERRPLGRNGSRDACLLARPPPTPPPGRKDEPRARPLGSGRVRLRSLLLASGVGDRTDSIGDMRLCARRRPSPSPRPIKPRCAENELDDGSGRRVG